jgi:serine/threonine protein kinase
MNKTVTHIEDSRLQSFIEGLGIEADGSSSEHLSQCLLCQTRLEELAAASEEWSFAKESLASNLQFDHGNRQLGSQDIKSFFATPSHPELLGRIGRYEVEKTVGAGGMGVVFKAYDTELHRSVAIKFLSPHLTGNNTARQRFSREARAAAAVVHDHVVPIYNVEETDEKPYLVMQFIAGDSLQAKIDRDGALEVQEILRIGMQVSAGLSAAHAQGLIHRDVKPSNVLLDETVSRALLSDFGLARMQDDADVTRTGCQLGTPHYMSPEQVRGDQIDQRSDLFSFGCVLYALCTGHPPFRADNSFAVMRRIQDDEPQSIREQNDAIPGWLEAIVMRLLEKVPENRYQSAQELVPLFEQCIAHLAQPTTSPLPLLTRSTWADSGHWARGFSKWIIGIAAVVSLIFGIFVLIESSKGTIRIESESDNVPIRITKGGKIVERLTVNQSGNSVRVAAGEYLIEFESDDHGLEITTEKVVVTRGQSAIVQIALQTSPSEKSTQSDKTSTSQPRVGWSEPQFSEKLQGEWAIVQASRLNTIGKKMSIERGQISIDNKSMSLISIAPIGGDWLEIELQPNSMDFVNIKGVIRFENDQLTILLPKQGKWEGPLPELPAVEASYDVLIGSRDSSQDRNRVMDYSRIGTHLRITAIPLRNAPASTVANTLRDLCQEQNILANVGVDQRQNILVVSAEPDAMEKVVKMIKAFDENEDKNVEQPRDLSVSAPGQYKMSWTEPEFDTKIQGRWKILSASKQASVRKTLAIDRRRITIDNEALSLTSIAPLGGHWWEIDLQPNSSDEGIMKGVMHFGSDQLTIVFPVGDNSERPLAEFPINGSCNHLVCSRDSDLDREKQVDQVPEIAPHISSIPIFGVSASSMARHITNSCKQQNVNANVAVDNVRNMILVSAKPDAMEKVDQMILELNSIKAEQLPNDIIPFVVTAIPLRHASANMVAQTIRDSCEQQEVYAKVSSDERHNRIVLSAEPEVTKKVIQMIESLDVASNALNSANERPLPFEALSSTEAIQLFEDYYAKIGTGSSYDHPEMQHLRNRIEMLGGERYEFNRADILRRMRVLLDEREKLLEKVGQHYPELRALDIRYQVLERIGVGAYRQILQEIFDPEHPQANAFPKELQGMWVIADMKSSDKAIRKKYVGQSAIVSHDWMSLTTDDQMRTEYFISFMNRNQSAQAIDFTIGPYDHKPDQPRRTSLMALIDDELWVAMTSRVGAHRIDSFAELFEESSKDMTFLVLHRDREFAIEKKKAEPALSNEKLNTLPLPSVSLTLFESEGAELLKGDSELIPVLSEAPEDFDKKIAALRTQQSAALIGKYVVELSHDQLKSRVESIVSETPLHWTSIQLSPTATGEIELVWTDRFSHAEGYYKHRVLLKSPSTNRTGYMLGPFGSNRFLGPSRFLFIELNQPLQMH